MARCFNHKLVLNFCNLLFLLCGTMLIVSGCYLYTDTRRILLSRLLAAPSERLSALPQPLLYYIALGLCVAGFVAVLAAVIGFWASCLHTYCFLSVYFLSVVVLLLAESVVCLAITLWPHCLGISLDETQMVKALQANYGIPGQEQFTNAMDLAQTRFGCCGMSGAINYDTSLWRLQEYGQRNWAVPLSCCVLENAPDRLSYLDPKPANESQCQSLERTSYERERYTESCLPHLDGWYREQYSVFLGASLVMGLVEFCVLLAIILSCTGIATQRATLASDTQHLRKRAKSRQVLVENLYEPEVELRDVGAGVRSMCLGSRHVSSEDFKELYVQPRDLYKQRHNTTFKPIASDYQTPMRSYLV
ncbi:tetraspanin-12 [Scaptodrosophila lebanonensis]|uniref:Tetraspanin-12 n=1 Tax=Drosophila lebanonensis TaxID=7225 RepID=A0A6J2U5G0_DROLE|nr:tetraspanin-12 [Scaptodrosophila lebanonensis]